jgi:hypothetical protein
MKEREVNIQHHHKLVQANKEGQYYNHKMSFNLLYE